MRRFAQGSFLAVALAAFFLLLLGADVDDSEVEAAAPAGNVQEAPPAGDEAAVRGDDIAREATAQARETFDSLWTAFVASLPQVVVALLVLFLAWLIVRLTRPLIRRATRSMQKGPAIAAVFGIVVWLFAVGVAISVIAGDIRALVGSIGLIGLALSWALQTPIESFTGWLMNSFHGYYRVGDRIAVGEVFGDVARVDFLTTTVWEYGGSDRAPSGITAEQPTGRLITFPNNEVLTGSIVNYTRDFPYVWDELAVAVAEESDLRYAQAIVQKVADALLADEMAGPARQYQDLLRRNRLEAAISEGPEVFVSMTASGVDLVIRYLVPARERRRWKSELTSRVIGVITSDEHKDKILPLYPRQQIQFVGPEGTPVAPGASREDSA